MSKEGNENKNKKNKQMTNKPTEDLQKKKDLYAISVVFHQAVSARHFP
jgi:hypothetical protein